MSISSDEVNFLIYRYLQENGFAHSAFTFAYESLVIKSSTAQTEIPPGALITFLQKGLEYIAIEEHINEDGSIQEYDNNFSLLSPLICEAVAVKEDRRTRRVVIPQNNMTNLTSTTSNNNNPNISTTTVTTTNEQGNNTISIGGGGNNNTGLVTDVTDMNSSTAMDICTTTTTTSVTKSTFTPSTLQLINEESGSRYLQLNGHQGEVFMCLWNPHQRQLASGSSDGMCRLWGLSEMNKEKWESKESEVTLTTAIMPHSISEGEKFKDVTSLTWSPDGKHLATGCYDGITRIWDNTGKLIATLKVHTGPVFSLKWSKSGTYILSGSYDRRAIVWNALSGEIFKTFLLHTGPVLDVDWKHDSDIFATCSSDRTINICQVSLSSSCQDSSNDDNDNIAIKKLEGHSDEVNALCWSPGGALLASCSDDSTAKIWTIEEGLKYDLQGHAKEIFTLRWTPTGEGSIHPEKPLFLCTASFDGTVKVWSGDNGELVFNLCKQVQPVYSLAPSPNGEYIATGSLGGNVSIWSLSKGEPVRELQGVGDTFDVSWSIDGTLLSSCFSSGTLCVLDTSNL